MTPPVVTPASSAERPTVAVLGAGVAGLTAAQELAERGFEVTVYEPARDERNGLSGASEGDYPPVKLGGLAASQFSTPGTHDGSPAELRPFPGGTVPPRLPQRAVAGEHGFRFFPAYYLHIWDLFQRIPVYARTDAAGSPRWSPTARTVMDNVRRVVTQGTTVQGRPSLVFPREAPRSLAEFLSVLDQLAQLGFTASDIATFQSRLLRFLTTSPLRRARELQNMSSYDFLVGRDRHDGPARFTYSPTFDALIREMPRVLVAFDPRWGDVRTNMVSYLQLYLNMDRRDDKADGVLNGPTTEAWLDHWYRHLVALGVRFACGAATAIVPRRDPGVAPHLRPRATVRMADGSTLQPDYTVVAVDAPAAERISEELRAAGTGGVAAGLDGFATSAPPPDGPLQPASTRPRSRRNPYVMAEVGRVPWDRFQTMSGIQYYFDTEFQLLRGHMYYAGAEWGLSSINQQSLWQRKPTVGRDGHFSVLSVDIADFNTPSTHLVDGAGHGKAARDCTADEIAAEVWRQIVAALTSGTPGVAEDMLPWPVWYALDRGLVTGHGRIVRNESPYLVPIVGDWANRPGEDPWNPHGTSWTTRPTEEWWIDDLERRNVWQARHGGYQVHDNSVVFAGTWTKTFTRMTSMEAACESARHAVNAILDHYVWVQSEGLDRRENTTLQWDFPYGFLDQSLSSPIRMPTPAGDYCYVFDVENREPADTRALRILDSEYCLQSIPHPFEAFTAVPPVIPTSTPTSSGGLPMSSPLDPNHMLLAHLRAWRQLIDQSITMLGAQSNSTAATPTAAPTSAPTSAPADYVQRLFGQVQAWRENLEQAVVRPAAPEQQAARRDSGPYPGTKQSATVQPPEMEVVAPMTVDGTQGPQSLYGRAYLGGPEEESTGGQSLYSLDVDVDDASRQTVLAKPRPVTEGTRLTEEGKPGNPLAARSEILRPWKEDLHVHVPKPALNDELHY